MASQLSPLQRAQIYRAYLRRLQYSSQDSAVEDKYLEQQSEELTNESVIISQKFCDWVENVGGEDSHLNIKAEKIITMFDIRQEKANELLTTENNNI
ncbi:hypothetical protein CHUAL_000387 [Chamberlinius hualienensis]